MRLDRDAPLNDMKRLVEPQIPALRRYARALVRDPVAADDLVQDCLERAITHWSQRRQDGDVRTWLFAILHNLAVNQMRQAARRGRHDSLDVADEAALSHQPTQESPLLQRDIIKALAALPEEQRSVLLLVSVEELSYAEAARVLDIPLGTVMSRLARAREKLREAMNGGNVIRLDASAFRRSK
jgi:RNA polymerase sigma factor (sigma-70 family)